MPAVYLLECWIAFLVFLFLTFRTWPFDFPVTAVKSFSVPPLPLSRLFRIKISREAVCAKVFFWHLFSMVVALNVLPGVTLWTIDCVTIVIRVDTDALDGIFLLFLEICV
jgi:hypothetical protein